MPAKTATSAETEHSPSQKLLPENWPEDINFLIELTYSEAVTPENRAGLSRSDESCSKIPQEALTAPSQLLRIKNVEDDKHPAYGQRGLFAACDLTPDSFLCLYIGHVHTNSLSDTDPHSDYDLSYDRETGLSIDSARCGNESRFANDYRGIAERPNTEFRDCLVRVRSDKRANGTKWERRVGIFVLSGGKAGKRNGGIKAGQEILVNYGKGFWEGRQVLAKFRKDDEMRK